MMESGLKIGALEGHAFCGKTTLAQKLRDQYGYVMVEEYARYAEGAKNFPSFPPDTYEDAKKAIDYFVELERRRSGDAVEAAQKENASVVMDRTFFSCLSFQRVVQLRMQNTPNSYLYSVEMFRNEADQKRIIVPPVVIALEPENVEVFNDRIDRRGRSIIDFHNDTETLQDMLVWYRDLIDHMYTDNSGLILTTIENEQGLVAYHANNFLQQANYSKKKLTF